MENPEQLTKEAIATSNTKETTNSTSVLKRKIVRDKIENIREVSVQGVDKVVMTTTGGLEIWANANQVPKDAEEVRFKHVKAGDTYVYNKETREVKTDSVWFVGAGKLTVDPLAKTRLALELIAELGLTNPINL